MALWNKVLSGFNADDETVNFGVRSIAENNGSIYETSTLATIQSDGEVITNPNVSASIQYSMLCVAIDKSITIFRDESCYEIILSIGFDSVITAYCMSKDTSFLFIALASGDLHCLHLPTGGRQVFYENIEEAKFGSDRIVQIFIPDEDEKQIILVSTGGILYGINCFNRQQAHYALIDDDETSLREAIKNINCTQIFKGPKTTEAAYIDFERMSGPSSIIIIGKNINLWPSQRRSGCPAASSLEYKKVQLFKNYGAMICLRADGSLSIVCPETLLGRKVWNGPVIDFVTVQDKVNDPYQILVLTVPKNDVKTTVLQFLSFPDFESIFHISVPKTTYLVDLVGCSVENIVYLEGIKNTHDKIETIRVKAIVESIPEYRLQRLLRREQFEEAEFFAKQFQLSLESVHAAKAAAFINQLGPWSHSTNDAAILDTFIATLDKIKDVQYIYNCCNNALTSNYKQSRKLLVYARERITQHMEQSNTQDFTSLLSTLNASLRKLETFEIIHKTKIAVDNGGCIEDVEEWIRFSRENLTNEYLNYLSLGELEGAAVIWIRHLSELSSGLTPNSIHGILYSISETVPPCKLWPWLCHFVPSVILLFPSALTEITMWGYKRTKSLEKYHRTEWPQIGLDFARGLIDLLSFEESSVCFYFHQQYANENSNLHRLTTLVQAMSDLLQLKTAHRIILPLEIYLGNPRNVVHLLLDKAHVDGIPNLIETFLQQYMLNYSLQNDEVFSSYIQKTLRKSKDWWFWEKAPWEQRVAIVIGYIHNVQDRLHQTVEVLKKAPVPWSDTVTGLAEASYSLDHPLVSKIRTESTSVPVKLILKKYGYAHVGLCTKLFRYIIKQNRDNMIDDICVLTKGNKSLGLTAFCLCTNYHLNKGNIDQALQVLNRVDEDTARYCCEQIINATIARFQFKSSHEDLAYYVEALGPVETKLQQICSQKRDYTTTLNNTLGIIPCLKRLYQLNKLFGLKITVTEYNMEKEKILERYINQLRLDLHNGKITMLNCCESLEKVSLLLDIPPLESSLTFYEKIKDISILKRSIVQTSRNCSLASGENFYVNKLCSTWISNAEEDFEVSMVLKNLCASNLTNCTVDQLKDALHCNDLVNAYVEATRNDRTCEAEIDDRITVENSVSLYSIYKDAAVSPGQILLPLFNDTLNLYKFYVAADTEVTEEEEEEEDTASQEKHNLLLAKSFLDRAKRIQNEHYDCSLLHITKTLHYGLSSLLSVSQTVMAETRATFSHCLYTLLRKIVCARKLDVTLGLSCLFMLSEYEATKWLTAICKSFQGDLVRHHTVIDLGYEYYRIIKNDTYFYTFHTQKLSHEWARRLTDYGISYKEVLNSDMNSKRDILQRVMNSGRPNLIPLLEEFCANFGFELTDCFLLYLHVLLTGWQPQLHFTTISGRKELRINEHDVNELKSKCEEVAMKINDKVALNRHLHQLSPQINFYHYEVFIIMLNLIGEKNVENTFEYFCFLQDHTRYGRPTDHEREEWANLCHENSSFPPIAEWRLPYLPKVDQCKLITPELNLKTYEKWLSIAPILKLPSHVICTLAIKGSVTEVWKNFAKDTNCTNSWCIYPRNSALLKDIKKCIKCISGPDALHYGTAALYYVVNHTPQGADQVAAAQECFASAQLWQQQSNTSNDGLIEKIKDKYLRLTSKHILHTHGLGENRYLNLIGYPEKLIRELYNDESIPERFKGAIERRPDVNAAANALGKLFTMNMVKIRLELLQDWLQPETWSDKPNDSMTFGIPAQITPDNSNAEDNLLRACYILGCDETESYANYLINISFDEEKEDGYGPTVRFRALRVLQSITDEEALRELTKRDLTSIRLYMKSLKYLSELEHLGLGYSVSSFESCSKHKLAQILLKTQYYAPRALNLILQMYIDFEIDDRSLLNATLERMAKQSMVKELEKTLPVISTINHIVSCAGYIAAWQLVIANPFEKLDPQPSPKQKAQCIISLRLLHACPVITELEFMHIISRCFHCKQAHFAAALLPFLNDEAKDYVLQGITKTVKVIDVISDLKALTPKGILVVPQSVAILQDYVSVHAAIKRENL